MCLNVLLACMSVYHICTETCGSRIQVSDALEMELFIVVCCLENVCNQIWSPCRSVTPLNCSVTSVAQVKKIMYGNIINFKTNKERAFIN